MDFLSALRTYDFICVDEHYLLFFFLSVIMVMFLHCIPISIVYCPVIFTHLRRDITVRYLGLSNYDLAGRGR